MVRIQPSSLSSRRPFDSLADPGRLNGHRYYYFLIAVSSLTLIFVLTVVALYHIHLLLPLPILLVAFVLFVLWLTGLIKSSIELWGPMGSVNDNCVRYVYQAGFWGGRTIDTLARIQQEGMCNLWKTAFAMQMIACFCLVWFGMIAWQVRAAAGY